MTSYGAHHIIFVKIRLKSVALDLNLIWRTNNDGQLDMDVLVGWTRSLGINNRTYLRIGLLSFDL